MFAMLKMRLRHDLPTSVNGRAILPFREGFISAKLHLQKIKPIMKISEFTVPKDQSMKKYLHYLKSWQFSIGVVVGLFMAICFCP